MPYIRVIEPEDAEGELREAIAVVVSRATGLGVEVTGDEARGYRY